MCFCAERKDMKAILKSFSLFVLTVSSGLTQTLWQNLDYGMTIEAILQAQPKGERTKNGNVKLPTLDLVDEKFEGVAVMKNDILTVVSFSTDLLPSTDRATNAYKKLVIALRGKYGQEIGTKNAVMTHETVWKGRDGTDIALTLFHPGRGGQIVIAYSKSLASESNKL